MNTPKKKTHIGTKIFLAFLILTGITSLITINNNKDNPPFPKQVSKMSRTLILDEIRPLTPKPTSKFSSQSYTASQKPDGTWLTKGSVTFTDHTGTTHTQPYFITYTPTLDLKTYAFNGKILQL